MITLFSIKNVSVFCIFTAYKIQWNEHYCIAAVANSLNLLDKFMISKLLKKKLFTTFLAVGPVVKVFQKHCPACYKITSNLPPPPPAAPAPTPFIFLCKFFWKEVFQGVGATNKNFMTLSTLLFGQHLKWLYLRYLWLKTELCLFHRLN